MLYSFRRCPYAMRARLALLAAGQACELREVVLRDKPQALRDASPKATVPVLVLADGTVIDQSLDIMLWALRRSDPQQWLAPASGTLADMLALVDACDRGFKPALDRYKYPQRHSGQDPLQARVEGGAFLGTLEGRLAAAPQLFGARPSLADAAIMPFVRQFAAVDAAWFESGERWPALRGWLAAWQACGLFAAAMQKFPVWHAGQARQEFAGAAAARDGLR